MADTKEKVETPETTPEVPKSDIFTALSGTGIDVDALKKKADEEEKKFKDQQLKEEPTKTGEKKEELEKKEEPTKKEEPEKKEETYEFKVGEKVLFEGKTPEDGEYPIDDKQMAVVKDGKIEEIKPIEEKPKADASKETKTEYDNPFISEGQETKVAEIKEFKDVTALFKAELDIDIKDVGDLGKLVTEFKTLQNNLTKASVDVQKLADWNATLESMPEEIYGVMQAWLNGEDYLDVMQHESRQKPDFTKDFGANSQEVMLNYYHPGKFSKEDYQDEEMQDKISLAMDSAKKLFEKDKKDYRTYRDQVADKANQKTQALQTSIDTTLNALKKDVPYIRDNHKKRIEDVINLGPRGVMSLFINDDGTFKPEAAKLVSLAVYGEDAINFHKNRAAKDGETKATEELLQRGTGDKSKRLTPEKVADTREEFAEKEISRIVPDMGGRTPFSRKYTGPPEKKK